MMPKAPLLLCTERTSVRERKGRGAEGQRSRGVIQSREELEVGARETGSSPIVMHSGGDGSGESYVGGS